MRHGAQIREEEGTEMFKLNKKIHRNRNSEVFLNVVIVAEKYIAEYSIL